MLNYKKYKRVPVLHYPEREWPDKEIEQRGSARWQSGTDRSNECRREDGDVPAASETGIQAD